MLTCGCVRHAMTNTVSAVHSSPTLFRWASNVQLFTITRALGGDYDDALARLSVFTWLKWGALALALAWLAHALRGNSRTERVVAGISMLAAALAVGAFFDRAHFAELFALAVTGAFLGLFVVSIQRARA
jgi:hypothetical protein